MIRVNEAIALARKQGNKVNKTAIAERLWPGTKPSTRRVNMTNLVKGKTAGVRPEWLVIISEMTGCSLDFLLGKEDTNTNA